MNENGFCNVSRMIILFNDIMNNENSYLYKKVSNIYNTYFKNDIFEINCFFEKHIKYFEKLNETKVIVCSLPRSCSTYLLDVLNDNGVPCVRTHFLSDVDISTKYNYFKENNFLNEAKLLDETKLVFDSNDSMKLKIIDCLYLYSLIDNYNDISIIVPIRDPLSRIKSSLYRMREFQYNKRYIQPKFLINLDDYVNKYIVNFLNIDLNTYKNLTLLPISEINDFLFNKYNIKKRDAINVSSDTKTYEKFKENISFSNEIIEYLYSPVIIKKIYSNFNKELNKDKKEIHIHDINDILNNYEYILNFK